MMMLLLDVDGGGVVFVVIVVVVVPFGWMRFCCADHVRVDVHPDRERESATEVENCLVFVVLDVFVLVVIVHRCLAAHALVDD